jgi:hypothetical protein
MLNYFNLCREKLGNDGLQNWPLIVESDNFCTCAYCFIYDFGCSLAEAEMNGEAIV